MRENAKVGSLQLCIYLKVSAPVGLSLAPKSVLTTFLYSPWSFLWPALTSKFPQQACTKNMAFLSCPRTLATYITAATHITGRVTSCPSLPRAVHFQHCRSHVPGNLSVSGETDTILILIQMERNQIMCPKISLGLENQERLERRGSI